MNSILVIYFKICIQLSKGFKDKFFIDDEILQFVAPSGEILVCQSVRSLTDVCQESVRCLYDFKAKLALQIRSQNELSK